MWQMFDEAVVGDEVENEDEDEEEEERILARITK
jgi:hypothetical protein